MTTPERRQFSRIPFDAWAEIHQGDRMWNALVADISLKGLLIEKPARWQASAELPVTAIIRLGEDEVITMRARQAHERQGMIGFRCEDIDIDSITTLRRLVELNLGDSSLLERELSALSSEP